MPRAIWTGSLSFGLVNIPIEVHTAVRDQRPHFRMLHAKDRSPINFERICQKDGKSVAWNDIVKGYEYEKGHFAVLDKEDFAAAALEKTRRIDVLDFVEAQAIDDRYFDKPYYLLPGKGGAASEPWPGAWQKANHRAPGQGKAIEARRENLIYRSSSRPRSTRAFSC